MPELNRSRPRRYRRGGIRSEVWYLIVFLGMALLMVAVATAVMSARLVVPVIGLR